MVRVSTAIAGSSWGMVAIPRIGQEVIVDFLEGDPDQPIIVGSVYNKENKVPYSLPDNMTQSGFKSRSTSGKKDSGEPKNFNEIRFEDKKDNEEVFIQAEKDFKRIVKNNDVLQVGLQTKDDGDQTIEIYNNRTVTLKDGKEGNDKLTIEKGNREVTIEKGDRTVKIKNGSDDLNVKKKITYEAGDEIVLKVGKAKLIMKKSGQITIEGMNISIKDSGATKIDAKMDLGIKGGLNAKVEGGINLDLKGGAMAKLKGGITMIG
jgi:type VI secretion system secreted protein VgrG